MIAIAITVSIPVFNLLAALSSGLAAIFWYRASQVKAPPKALLGSSGWAGPDDAPNAGVDATPLVEYAQESGRRNKIAALWSATAALFAFLSWTLGLLADPFTP
jgi:hypothetical protein